MSCLVLGERVTVKVLPMSCLVVAERVTVKGYL